MKNTTAVTILLMTLTGESADAIQQVMSGFRIVFLKSNPSYANYLKILQYTPDAIIIELPQPCNDQLHFIQLIKQNSLAGTLPIICFGEALPSEKITGMKKIGISTYIARPFDYRIFSEVISEELGALHIALSRKTSP